MNAHNRGYFITVHYGGEEPQKVQVVEELTLGSGDKCDISITNEERLPDIAAKFRVQSDTLAITYLGGNIGCSIKDQTIGHGKKYILTRGDEILIGDVRIVVTKEAIAHEESKEDVKIGIEPQKKEQGYRNKFNKGLGRINRRRVNASAKGKSKTKAKKNLGTPTFGSRLSSFLATLAASFAISFHLLPTLPIKESLDEIYRAYQDHILTLFLKKVLSPISPLEGVNQGLDRVLGIIVNNLSGKLEPIREALTHMPIEKLVLHLSPQFANFAPVVYLIIAYVVIDLLSHILFSTGFGLFLCGVTTEGNFIIKRVRAFIRWAIGLVTLPFFIILDLPGLIGKRTFREVITGSHLSYTSKFAKIVGSLILIPMIQLFSIFSPLVFNYQELTTPSEVININVNKNMAPSLSDKVTSHIFNIEADLEPIFGTFSVPTVRSRGDLSIPVITFVNDRTHEDAELSFLGNVNMTQRISLLVRQDMFIRFLSPNLYKYVTSNMGGDFTSLPREVAEEYKDIIMGSLTMSLDIDTIYNFIKKRGISFGHYIKLRKAILSDLDPPKPRVFTIHKNKEKELLLVKNKNNGTYIIPMGNMAFPIYQVEYKGKKTGLAKKLIIVLARSKAADKSKIPPSSQAYDAFRTLDVLTALSEEPPYDEEVRRIVEYFTHRGDQALKKGSDHLKVTVAKAIRSIDIYLKDINMKKHKNKNIELEQLRTSLNRIKDAVTQSDAGFFESKR